MSPALTQRMQELVARVNGTVGTGPVPGGTGPARYLNRPGSHWNRAYKFGFSVNRSVSPVNRAGFFFAETGHTVVPLTLLAAAGTREHQAGTWVFKAVVRNTK
jgi:hypothetical protein